MISVSGEYFEWIRCVTGFHFALIAAACVLLTAWEICCCFFSIDFNSHSAHVLEKRRVFPYVFCNCA